MKKPGSSAFPAGSFRRNRNGRFSFLGVSDGVAVKVQIAPLGGDTYKLKAEGEGADLTGAANPVTVELTIGDDGSNTTVQAEFD